MGNSRIFPIVISNLSRLDDCLSAIEKGFLNIINDLMCSSFIGPHGVFYAVTNFRKQQEQRDAEKKS